MTRIDPAARRLRPVGRAREAHSPSATALCHGGRLVKGDIDSVGFGQLLEGFGGATLIDGAEGQSVQGRGRAAAHRSMRDSDQMEGCRRVRRVCYGARPNTEGIR